MLFTGGVQDLTLLHRREWKSLPKQNHKASRKNMITVRTDPIPMMMERSAAMLIMFPKSKLCSFMLLNVMGVILLCYPELLVFILYTVPRRRKDYSASGKRKEERQASLPRQSKEHDEHKKRGSYTPDDRDDPRDADNGSKE